MLRYLTAIVVALFCLAGCTSTEPELPFPTTVPTTSASPILGPPLRSPWAPLLVNDFSGRGREPVPSFWGELYTIVIACTGSGSVQVWDAALTKAPIYRGLCEGSEVRLPDSRPALTPVNLWIVGDPSVTWSVHVEKR